MMRRAYVGLIVMAVALIAASPVLAIVAILANSDRLGGVVAVLIITGVVAGLAAGCWSEAAPAPLPKRIPKADRLALQRERRRIALDVAIREAEQDAGIMP